MVAKLLLFSTLMVLIHGVTSRARFTLGTVYDTESRWGPKPGEEYLYIMQISCERRFDPMPLNSAWSSVVPPKIIHILNCTLPTIPLPEAFKLLNFDITNLDKLKLTDANLPKALPKNYTAGLPITKLELTNVSQMPKIFFTSLTEFYKLTVENMEIPPLEPTVDFTSIPGKGRLLVLQLRNATMKNMVNCEFIEDLSAIYMDVNQISEWPEGCGIKLRHLQLESMTQAAVHKMATIRPYLFIESLIVKNCSLDELPLRLMKGLSGRGRRVFSISLPNNNLKDKALLQFPIFKDMNYLDLSNNHLTGDFLKSTIPKIGGGMHNLNKLFLDGNNFNVSIFEDHEIKSIIGLYYLGFYASYKKTVIMDDKEYIDLTNQPSLEVLSLSRMHLKPDCLKHTHFNRLTNLNLASNSSEIIENLQLYDLPSTGANQITVDLRGHGVRTVRIGPNFTENFENLTYQTSSDHWLIKKRYKLVVLLDFIDCDCNNDVLQRALQKFPGYLSMPSLKCNSKNGSFFSEEPMENLSCRKAIVNGCKRKLSRGQNYTTLVDCSNIGSKFRWPRPQGLRSLNVSGNGITSLRNAYLPESLKRLDLRYNNLSSLTLEESSLLFGTSNRRVWLAGNNIFCNCKNRPTIEALQTNKAQIVDYSEVPCLKGGPVTLLKMISIFELCKSGYSDNDLSDFGLPDPNTEKKIVCSGPLELERKLSSSVAFELLSLERCLISRERLSDVLNSLNININELRTLRLNHVIMPQNVDRGYGAGLGMRNLELVNIRNFPYNFFIYQGSLRRLTVEDMDVPYLPPSNHIPLFELTLKNSTMYRWNCIHLQTLKLFGINIENIKIPWPEECGGLRFLLMKNMTQEAVEHVIMTTNGTALMYLVVNRCSLVKLPLNLMIHLDRLNALNLSHNELEDHAFLQFPDLINLESLDLAHNKLKGEFLEEVIRKVPKLRNLVLDGNNFVHVFQNLKVKSAITTLEYLERLSLNNMILDPDCLMYSNFSELKYLGLRSLEDQKLLLKLQGLPRTGAAQLTVDLSGRSFKSVQIEREFKEDFENQNIVDSWITNKGYSLVISIDYVDCVCNNDVLSRILREFSAFLSMPGLRCDRKNGPLFINEPLERLNCLKATVHGCKRRISRDFDYVTSVDCSNNSQKFRWPRPNKNYRYLNASGNGITSLNRAYLPETLQFLDLRNNKISRLDGNQTALLFNSTRQMWLSGNPIECHCDNHYLLNALRTNHSQIMDYDAITCTDTEQFLRLVSVDELCRFKVEFIWWTLIALAILTLTAVLLMRHYWVSLRVYLYARGFCLSWLHEEDVDDDRPFDAFLSFAHGDNQYVIEQLLPQLESEPNFYRICVHYRDWAVGEWIPAQIMHSVRLSKRTIIVLSKNFVRSLWGSMEFRCALAAAETEGRLRLLILVLDDVQSDNLSLELSNFLRLNTYLRCDDPWFWEKLRFAMPRTRQRVCKTQNCTSELLNMNEIQPNDTPNHSAPMDVQNNFNFRVRANQLKAV